MAEIITAYYSRLYVEGQEEALRKRANALALWDQKREASREEVYNKYSSLFAEILILENRRLSLLDE
jgi:hypothetical protein